MSNSERGQVNTSAAEVYDAFFVPALFQEWAGRMVKAAHVQSGQHVLDVGCGTGVFARAAAERVGPAGEVVGLDINEGMLAVARRKAPHIEWRCGPAEALPLEDNRFDAVACQFALMFFEERQAALREMVRVLRPGGRLAVAVWDTVENTPGYSAMGGLLQRLCGAEAANALRAPFNLGDTARLQTLFAEAGLPGAIITSLTGTARFESITAWVTTEIKGWTLADTLDDNQFEQLLAEAESVLKPFVRADGTVTFESPAHIVTVIKEDNR
ncbi:MAG: methyltransferase domain-containing protein, partial [Anaerolineae bacterium]|nr:methyltransferase domain-containing protein [Anaerolineae bacterium]